MSVLLFAFSAKAEVASYVVTRGDTLSTIAARHRLTVGQLRRWNTLDDTVLRVGQELLLSDDRPVTEHLVVPGDTLSCIARRHGVSLDAIVAENEGLNPQRLEIGQRIQIRGGVVSEDAYEVHYRVREGDTLSALTAQWGIGLTELRALNPEVTDDHIAVGQRLRLPFAPPTEHVIMAGDRLHRLARRYEVSVAALQAWNPEVESTRLRVGDALQIRYPRRRSLSVGAPNCGSISGSVPLGQHPAYILRNSERAYATERTVARIRAGFGAVRRRFSRIRRVRVHDLSLEGGGAIDDHRSHQSGRDVDITYYQRRGCGAEGCPLRNVDASSLDVRRQWFLFHHWLRQDDLEVVFVDYRLQEALYREARRRGATGAQLETWFQYPRGRWHRGGIIRHFPHHRDHLHARFRCDSHNARCE